MSTQAHGNISAGSCDLEAARLAIILRSGLADPIVGLITRPRDTASDYGALNLVSRATPATDDEKSAHAAAVSAAAVELADHLHKGLLKAGAR